MTFDLDRWSGTRAGDRRHGRRRPEQHRKAVLVDGGLVIFTTIDVTTLDTRLETVPIGAFLVTTPPHTLIDLVARPALAGLPEEARDAARTLAASVDRDRVTALVTARPKTVQQRVRHLLDQVPEHTARDQT